MKHIAICIALILAAPAALSAPGHIGAVPAEGPGDEHPSAAPRITGQHAAAANNTTWSIETVDGLGKTGMYTDIASGPDGAMFISYHDFLRGDLRCAYQTDGAWNVEEVDTTGDVGAYTSIDVGSDGQPCIAYYDETNKDLKYTVRDSDGWTVETADASGDVGRYASLGLDGQGTPHIVYYEASGQNLQYATRMDGSWHIETVASEGNAGRYAAIAIDGAGQPHCTYGLDETTLMYARRTADGWQSSQVDSDIKLFESTAIAMEGGTPHVSYFDISGDPNWRLRYATITNGQWSTEVVDPTIYGFWNERGLDIAVRDSVVHIGYFHWDDWNVGYAYKHGDTWTTEIVESQGDVGAFTAVTLDSQGYPHLSYMDRSNLALKYAWKTAYAPARPDRPAGPDQGRTGTAYTYVASTVDLDGDEMQYGWDWNGDYTVDRWTTFQPSGEENEAVHTWDTDGTYTVRVKARDSTGRESDWSKPLQVSMPYRWSRPATSIWQWLTEHISFLAPPLSGDINT